MTNVAVNTYTHSVTYVADNILKSLKDIIRLSGLDPAEFVGTGIHTCAAIQTWLNTGDLESVELEIYDPKTDALIFRWDIEISYSWSGGDGSFWTDTEQLRYAIRKAGLAPSEASYRLASAHEARPARCDRLVEGDCAFDRRDGPPEPRHHHRAQRPRRQHVLSEESLMLTIDEAFRKFKSRLELNDREQDERVGAPDGSARLSRHQVRDRPAAS